MVYAFMADGCEEVEALAVIDLLRRAGEEVELVSIHNKDMTQGSHGIGIKNDVMLMPGTLNLGASDMVNKVIKKFAGEGKIVAAICAAPSALGILGILEGKNATCYPGFEDQLKGAKFKAVPVVTDGNITTSRGVGTAIPFALELIRQLFGNEKASEIAESIVYEE